MKRKTHLIMLITIIMTIMMIFTQCVVLRKRTPIVEYINVKNIGTKNTTVERIIHVGNSSVKNNIMGDNRTEHMPVFGDNTDSAITIKKLPVELFPITDITLGMTVEELIRKHPDKGYRPPTMVDSMTLQKSITFGCRIDGNPFWNMLLIYIEGDKVETLTYRLQNNRAFPGGDDLEPDPFDFENPEQITQTLFEQLKHQLGATFEKRIVHYASYRAVMYVWKRENEWIAFIPTPILPDGNDTMPYQLLIVPTEEALGKRFSTVTDNRPEDTKLWLETTP